MTYLDTPIERVICDTCGWNMQADNQDEASVLLLVHLDVWAGELELNGTEHTRANRAKWLKENAK